MAMMVNGDRVLDDGRGSLKAGLVEEEVVLERLDPGMVDVDANVGFEEEVVLEKLDPGMVDVDGNVGFEEANGVSGCRGGEQANESKTENGEAKVDKAQERDLVVHGSEIFEEALELPSEDGNGATRRKNPLQRTTVCFVEDMQESVVGEGVQHVLEFDEEPVIDDREIDRQGDSVEVIHQDKGEAEPERIGLLVADANGADVGPSFHAEDFDVEVNCVSVDGFWEHTRCDQEEFPDKNSVPQEKCASTDDCVQVSAAGTSIPDTDKKVGGAGSPEDVPARISKGNESEFHTEPEEGLKVSNHSENFSTGVEKSNIYGSVKSFAEEIEIAESKYGDGVFVKEETEEKEEQKEVEVGLISAVDVDQQFDSPDEVRTSQSREEEESNLNVTEEFPRVHDREYSETSESSETCSDEESVPSTQLRSIEELLHKHIIQSTVASDISSEATLIGLSSESSTGLTVHSSRPAGLGSSAPLLEPISRAHHQARANEIGTSCSSQALATDNKRNQVEGSSPHETAQPVSHCDTNSSEHVENKLSQPLKLDEPSQTETHENPRAATSKSGSESIGATTESSSGSGHPPARPAGLGSSAPLLERAPRSQPQARVNGTVQSQVAEETISGEVDEDSETREKLQMIRVKFLRLAHRLGQTPHNPVVAQVLYRLGLAEQLRGSRGGGFSFDRASAMAEQLEAAGHDALDFSCTIMVLGKTGVGKSATINSIFDEAKFSTNAFQTGTKSVQAVDGTVQGIKVRVIDTPGLHSSFLDQRHNEKILRSVKNFIKRTPPDIVLYLDRLDMQSRDYGDLPLLRTITDIFGPSIWFNAIVVLTHAASAPPEGPNGTLSYEMFVAQRSHVVQQAIRQAAGDMRLMNPVSLVENHSACRTNRAGQRVLPNGQVWKPHLLLLSFASKILSEANALLKLQNNAPVKPFGLRSRVPPLPFLLSTLLQSRPQLRLPEEQLGDEDAEDEDLDDSSDSEDEDAYNELPPFKRLTKQQISKLSKEQRKAYFDELDYREKLFMKKQLKEERRRRKLLKKMAASSKHGSSEVNENVDEESGGSATVPVPMPDMALPASFDSDNATHRYRCLDNSNQWLVRPVFEAHGWDHDVGYEGLNVERLFVVRDKVPVSLSGQITKDKKESSLQLECASSIKHGEGKATSLGFDMQTVGKDIAYTLRSETRFSNYKCNKAAAGLSVTLLGEALTAGLKFENKLMVGKRLKVVMNGGAMTGKGNVAYGGSLEATLRDKDYPIGRALSTLGLSIMDWHGDLAVGCSLQSQFPVGRGTNIIGRANLNNRGAGQLSIRWNSSEQFQIALVALLPLMRSIVSNRLLSFQPTQ